MVSFGATNGRYIKFKSLSEQNGNNWTAIAELSFVGCIDNSNAVNNQIRISDIKAYPIPAINQITIDLPQNNNTEKWNYQIISSAGKIIQSNTFESNSSHHTFSLQKVKPGLYFIQLKNGDSTTYHIKFVKN